MDYKELYLKIHNAAFEKAMTDCGNDIMIYPCGYAAIKLPVKTFGKDHPFIKWLVDNDIATYVGYEKYKYFNIYVGKFNQSVLHKEAYADEFVRLLDVEGMQGAISYSRLT